MWDSPLLGGLSLAAFLFGLNPIAILFGGGLLGMLARRMTKLRASGGLLLSPMLPHKVFLGNSTAATYASRFGSVTAVAVASLAAGAVVARPSLGKIALFFLKIGAVLYGGGYVLLAFLEQGLVRQHAWLTQQQLLDAVAIGQFTPGPVLSTATFIGYILAGVPGAAVATVAIFLPSFFYVALLAPVLFRLRESAWMARFLIL
jgi:chromate transporter